MSWLKKHNHWLLIAAGTIIWSATMIKSGLIYDFGMGFWGPNGHDGIWHVALINSLSRGSFEMPIFAGAQIKNYHLGFDILLAVIHFLTRISVINLYFQIIPPVLAFLIGWLTYKLTKNLWVIFFVYFGGSLGWVLGKGESTFWSQQAISTLINPPFALSLVLLLLLLLLLKKERYILAALVVALLPQVKIYAGLLAFFGLIAAGIKNKKIFLTLIIGLLIYLPSNYQLLTNNSKLLVWNPGWFLQTLFAPDRLNWPRLFSALTTYSQKTLSFKSLLAYLFAFAVFWVGNMGSRLFKEILIFKWVKNVREITWLDSFYAAIIIAGGIIPMFFLQTGTAWNTIQFFYYSLFFSSILAGLALSEVLKIKKLNNYLRFGICVFVIAGTLLTTWDTLTKVYLPSRPPAKISPGELQALNYLKKLPSGVVLTYPGSSDPYASPPRPLYLYESTAYVSAISGQPTYLSDEVNLNITNYPWQDRRLRELSFFNRPSVQFLTQNQIKYIYLLNQQIPTSGFPANKIFSNSEVVIYSVN
ncbi:hypothetical protein A2634_05015 [Candidatus Amesbacteria bacterium RIFCSPHIGHO2_01_FULL_48_32]|uniref:Glycosyltransferase RgtA/B/C/D-like domain-containing protein n=1 Tax=Candidatus Amesbacteria bacterium RIFCSPLOWO2_01_FULL_48_25 TaxID=1797259 RepID=A0A1F4ZCF4_9BACT|nr:MAG: hypothetical protein A2634_05015 [Candidatus Amesbacteria bacterium RIFCSPHIGHO2_01_FULL_48_32]OGD04029.1 MAG: hypothetical protein A2989_01365 [Candidatus Amesbacteria bacterium RIFCSPLOWO2_01_FULL_48_25]